MGEGVMRLTEARAQVTQTSTDALFTVIQAGF